MEKEVLVVNLHVGQFVEGQMVTSINADKYDVQMTVTEIGVDVVGHLTNKTIPFSNIQGIDYRRSKKAD